MTRQENWTEFLYLLMRDEVPLGTVAKIVQKVEENTTTTKRDTQYTGLRIAAVDFMRRVDAL